MDVDRMYEVRFKGRWDGPLAHALDDLDAREDAGDMVVKVRDHPALVALMNRASELGLATEDVTRVGGVDSAPDG